MTERELKPSEQRRIDQQQVLLEAIRRMHENHAEDARRQKAAERRLLDLLSREARKHGN